MEPNGVRQRPDDILVFHGQEGAKAFFDDVYKYAREKAGDIILTVPAADKYFTDILGEYRFVHIERMTALGARASVRCVLTEDKEAMPAARYCQYRWISRHYVDSVPFYVYDDKYAIIVLNADPSPKITVIQSREIADAYRKQFESMWEKGTPLN